MERVLGAKSESGGAWIRGVNRLDAPMEKWSGSSDWENKAPRFLFYIWSLKPNHHIIRSTNSRLSSPSLFPSRLLRLQSTSPFFACLFVCLVGGNNGRWIYPSFFIRTSGLCISPDDSISSSDFWLRSILPWWWGPWGWGYRCRIQSLFQIRWVLRRTGTGSRHAIDCF